jgi:hypothetical protein
MSLRPDKVLTYLHAESETSTRGTSACDILNKVQVKVYSIRIARCGHAINLVSRRIHNILHTLFDVFASLPEGRRGGKTAVNQAILWLTRLRSNVTFVNAYLAQRILQIAPVRSASNPVGSSK